MVHDCIVIGGGVVGSSAAYHLAMKGKQPLLLEQFSLPHTRGSSHGATRLLRLSYEDPLYSHMTLEALQIWKRLEKENNTQLFRNYPMYDVTVPSELGTPRVTREMICAALFIKDYPVEKDLEVYFPTKTGDLKVNHFFVTKNTGVLVIEEPPHDILQRSLSSVQAAGGDCRELNIDEVKKRYPSLMRFSSSERVYMEYTAGTLRADKALVCLREQIRKFGGHIQDEEKVTSIIPGQVVTVNTDKGTYQTKHLIITPGAWISQLLEPQGLKIPFQVRRISVCYWKENIPGSTKEMPAFIDITKETYSLPSSEYSGLMKICTDRGVETYPDCRDDCMDDKSDVEYMCNYVKERFPGLSCKPSIVESCMYTLTPDEDFVLDSLPKYPNIVFGAGFSGHGFKMSPVVGRILGEMVLGEKLSYDVSSLSMKRFPGAVLSSNF